MRNYIKTKSNKLNSFFEEQKNIVPLFLLVPTLIGGLWQIFELIFIDPSFIRFFSTSQLISDGILILSFLALIIAYIYFVNKIIDLKILLELVISERKFESKKLLLTGGFIILFIYYYYNAFDELGIFSQHQYRIGVIIFLFLLIGFFIPIFLALVFAFFNQVFNLYFGYKRVLLVKSINNWKKQLDQKKGSFYNLYLILSVISSLLIISTFFLSINVFISFRNKLIFPDNLDNLQNVFRSVKRDYGLQQKSSILYFNDKYIFIQLENLDIKNKESKRIKIYKTDDIFFK